ncbi:MAG: hypothetical protein KIT07_08980, partial [Anaerolineales bacterium]|nr:hypothetical protein [Anaerolineales bacterium]
GVDVVLSGIDTTEAINVAGQRAAAGDAVWAVPYDYLAACDNAPDICLGVPFFNWGPDYLALATAVVDGSWSQSWVWSGPNWADLSDLDSSAVGWLNGPGLSEEAAADLADYISKLASGEVAVWTGPINLQDGSDYIAAGEVGSDEQVWYLPQLIEGMNGPSQ